MPRVNHVQSVFSENTYMYKENARFILQKNGRNCRFLVLLNGSPMTKGNTCINSKQESFNTFREHYFTTIKHLLAVDQKHWTLPHM